MKYKIFTILGWKEVEGQPVNITGYEELKLFVHHFFDHPTISEPQTGLALRPGNTIEEAVEELKKISPEVIEKSRDDYLNIPVEIKLEVPRRIYNILERRSKGAISNYLTKPIAYWATRNHHGKKAG